MENMNREIVTSTCEHPETVVIIYPSDLAKEPILINNKKCLLDKFYRWLEINKQISYEEEVLSYLKFDIQIDKQIKIINDLEEQLNDIEDDMNENISPYKWKITTNRSGYLGSFFEKVDFVLALYKEEKEI